LSPIRRMLHGLGVQAKIALMRHEGRVMMPDGHGGARAYECDAVWRMLITSVDLQRLLYLGFEPKRLKRLPPTAA
jgi:ribonucleoside-diphosphate reductase alpha chain